MIRSTGFFRNKARSIRNCCQSLVAEYGGKVPDTLDELIQLDGIGRKTANVVLGVAYGKAEGIVVDTHVFAALPPHGIDPPSDTRERLSRR